MLLHVYEALKVNSLDNGGIHGERLIGLLLNKNNMSKQFGKQSNILGTCMLNEM